MNQSSNETKSYKKRGKQVPLSRINERVNKGVRRQNYAFHELNLNRVGLDVIGNNKNAVSCYEKCGFIVEGTVREAVLRDGQAYDRIYMGVLKNEWYSHLTDIVQ